MQNYENIIAHWKNNNIKTVSDLEQALCNYKILFAQHSGAIENPEITYHNTREIFENDKVSNYTGNLRAHIESTILNHKIQMVLKYLSQANIHIPSHTPYSFTFCPFSKQFRKVRFHPHKIPDFRLLFSVFHNFSNT